MKKKILNKNENIFDKTGVNICLKKKSIVPKIFPIKITE
jgi:hypothetical protein